MLLPQLLATADWLARGPRDACFRLVYPEDRLPALLELLHDPSRNQDYPRAGRVAGGISHRGTTWIAAGLWIPTAEPEPGLRCSIALGATLELELPRPIPIDAVGLARDRDAPILRRTPAEYLGPCLDDVDAALPRVRRRPLWPAAWLPDGWPTTPERLLALLAHRGLVRCLHCGQWLDPNPGAGRVVAVTTTRHGVRGKYLGLAHRTCPPESADASPYHRARY